MDWSSLQSALAVWVNATTSLNTAWADQHAPRRAYPFALLDIIAESQIGDDEVRWTYNVGGDVMDPLICGNRLFTLNVQVHTLDPSASTHPRTHLSNLRASLKNPENCATFRALELQHVRTDGTVKTSVVHEDRTVVVHSMDVVFACAENVTETADTYISEAVLDGDFDTTVDIDGTYGDI